MICEHCRAPFERRHNSQRFCGPQCQREAEKARRKPPRKQTVQCRVCGDDYQRGFTTKPAGRCPRCQNPRGADHPRWRGGETYNSALNRWTVRTPDGRTMYRYRWVMEQAIGRPLRDDEHIHHINGDSTDDRLENLEIVSPTEHARKHQRDQRQRARARMNFAWSTEYAECVDCGTTEREHVGYGRCSRCYFHARYLRLKAAA